MPTIEPGQKRKLKLDQTYNVGQTTLQKGDKPVFGPFSLPVDATFFKCSLDKTLHLHPGVQVTVAVLLSIDGGSTFHELASQTDIGGDIALDDNGKPVTTFDQEVSLQPQVGQTARQVKVTVEAKDGAFMTAGGFLLAHAG